MDPLQQFRATFFEECGERLAAAEGHLADLEAGSGDDETLHAIFRAIHSIKGGAGVFSFTRLVAFAHVFETALDALRSGRMAPAPDVISLLVRANDALADFVRAAEQGEELPKDAGETLRCALEQLTGGAAAAAPPDVAVQPAAGAEPEPRRFRIRFTPQTDMLRKANEPLLLIRQLRRLGEVTVAAELDRLPPLTELEAETAYLGWTIELVGTTTRAAILDIFEFVEDDCELTVEELAPALLDADASDAAAPSAGSPTAPTMAAGSPAKSRAAATSSIRVELDRVDRLVNLVGELVTTQAMLAQQARDIPAEQFPALLLGLQTMSQHTRELQESVMAIRAQPVRSVFARMPKLVRELAGALGKEARLVMTGEATEIDKTVIEQLGDPLTHMIRNAVDHGLEARAERLAAGKPPHGTIHLSAEHRSGRIIIEIADDGRGIDRRRVLGKAKEKGLVPVEAGLTDEEIDNLIFLPGFSTAAQVSDISGRGVGMDVVKRNIQALGGRVAITSTPGSGSCFTLSLPLTLAVLDGMIVAVGAEFYIVPITAIVESFRPAAGAIKPIIGRGEVVAIRGEHVTLAYLHRLFGVAGAVSDPTQGIVIIVETEAGGKLGIVVDELVGQQQVVIKSLEANYGQIEGVAAATILGSGKVALILDVIAIKSISSRGSSAAKNVAGPRRLSETTTRIQ